MLAAPDQGRDHGAMTKLPSLDTTSDGPLLRELGRLRCRHLVRGDDPFRQIVVWSCDPPRDIMGRDRDHIVLCVRCWSVIADFIDGTREFDEGRGRPTGSAKAAPDRRE